MLTHDNIWKGIDRLARSNGYSPSGLAKKGGLDPTSFNKSKRIGVDGKPRWPSTESVAKVLNVTNSTISDLQALMDDEDVTHFTSLSREEITAAAARILIETESVLFNADTPFTYKSGKQGPVYIDCRRLISFPEHRTQLMDYAAQIIVDEIGLKHAHILGGGETAGIPYAAFLADRLTRPMVYVRKEPKGHGRMAQIEGHFRDTQMRGKKPKVVLIEDLQTDGGSKKIFVDALRDAGAKVDHAFVLFHYGIFPESEKTMKKMGVQLHALCTWWDVLKVAKEENYFDAKTLKAVEAFLNNPEK